MLTPNELAAAPGAAALTCEDQEGGAVLPQARTCTKQTFKQPVPSLQPIGPHLWVTECGVGYMVGQSVCPGVVLLPFICRQMRFISRRRVGCGMCTHDITAGTVSIWGPEGSGFSHTYAYISFSLRHCPQLHKVPSRGPQSSAYTLGTRPAPHFNDCMWLKFFALFESSLASSAPLTVVWQSPHMPSKWAIWDQTLVQNGQNRDFTNVILSLCGCSNRCV